MKAPCIIALFAILGFVFTSSAYSKNTTYIFTDKDLVGIQKTYAENIKWNFRNTIWSVLSPLERQRLRNVELVFPLRSEYGGLLDYYTKGNKINMPVSSLKFFDDIAVATEWLDQKNYTINTVLDYVMFLKYLQSKDFPGGHYQKPLPALYIPASVYQNKQIDDEAQKILKSALIWILSHELGHVYYQHNATTNLPYNVIQQQEADADAFATEIMRRIGVAPIGMGLFFTVAVHWWPNRSDCPNQAAWNKFLRQAAHPPTAQRLRKLAELILRHKQSFARKEDNQISALNAIESAARTLVKMSNVLADNDLQENIRKRAKTFGALPDPLRPRKPGEMPKAPETEFVTMPVLLTTGCGQNN